MTQKRLNASQIHEAINRVAEASHNSSDLDDIISYLYSSSDISPLLILLNSPDKNNVRDGVYILSELGKSGFSLREIARSLLTHSDHRIRYWAMNSVVSCFEPNAAIDAISAAGLLEDADEFVRTRACEMVERLGR